MVTHTKSAVFQRNAAVFSGFNPFYMDTQDQKSTTEVEANDFSQESVEVDYKAELEAAQKREQEMSERLKKAEFTLKKKNLQKKEEGETPHFDPEAIEKMIEQKLEGRISAVRAAESVDDVDDVLANLSDNPDERALIKHIYDSRIAKTGFSRSQIREDLEAAKMLANAKKFQKMNSELEAALSARSSLGTAPLGSNLKHVEVKADFKQAFNQSDIAYMQSRGWSEEMIKKAAENIQREKNR